MKERIVLFTTRTSPTLVMKAVARALSDGEGEICICCPSPDDEYKIEGFLNGARYVFVDADYDSEEWRMRVLRGQSRKKIKKYFNNDRSGELAAAMRILKTLKALWMKSQKESCTNEWMCFLFTNVLDGAFMEVCTKYCQFPMMIVSSDREPLDAEQRAYLKEYAHYVLNESL